MRYLFSLLLFTSFASFAQDTDVFKPDSIRKVLEASQIKSSIKIDGVLKEEEWKSALPSPRFIQVEPHQGVLSDFETTVKVLYNKQFLYFGVFSRDSLGKKAIRATDFKRDFNFAQHDLLTLSFDGFNDKRNAMALATNAYGVQRDLLSFDDYYYDVDWDGLWKVRTTRTDSGWYAEIAIPWQTLRYTKITDSVQEWGFNIYRNRRLTNEISAFSPFPRSFSSLRMDYAGILKNLQPPPPKQNGQVQNGAQGGNGGKMQPPPPHLNIKEIESLFPAVAAELKKQKEAEKAGMDAKMDELKKAYPDFATYLEKNKPQVPSQVVPEATA